MRTLSFILLLSILGLNSSAQYKWKLEKNQDSIRVYTADGKNSSFKVVRVEATMKGSYSKLISILTNVDKFNEWIYHTKFSKSLKKYSTTDFVYYTEISMPWPVSNRDALIHLQIKTDSLPRFMTVTGRSEKGHLPEIPTKVRVPYYAANWRISNAGNNYIHISYTLELDPGGSLPAWVVNSFAEKGPFGTFSNLAGMLRK